MVARTKKINLARQQLEDGVELFLDKRYVSALTLLGAAEEIMSRLIEERTGAHPLDETWRISNSIRTHFGHPHISKREIHRSFNAGRNAVKHHSPGQPLEILHYGFGEAFMMVQRATGAAQMLALRYKNRARYLLWLRVNGWSK